MTANELIDKLESVSIRLFGKETEQAGRAIILYRESAIMLRQQAEEIEELKAIVESITGQAVLKYSDEWWAEVDLFNKSFPFGGWK
jgi:hypothetical protein